MKTKKKYMGILYIIISAFCFALMAMFVRLAGDLPSVQKSFFRIYDHRKRKYELDEPEHENGDDFRRRNEENVRQTDVW